MRDAPLANLSSEVMALEGRSDLLKTLRLVVDGAEVLTGKVENLELQLTKLLKEKSETAASTSTGLVAPRGLPYVANNLGGRRVLKVYEILIDGADVPPALWKAKCGFRFAFSAFTRHASLDAFEASTHCKSCGLWRVADAAAGTSSSSDSSESSG